MARRGNTKVALMRKVPLFDGLTDQQLTQIGRLADDVEVPVGKRLATTGETGRQMFIIVSGRAAVKTPRGRTIRLGAGDFFGEMSLLDGAPRSATVTAETEMQLLVLAQREFWELLAEAPAISRKIMSTLSKRLREVNAEYSPCA
ncbi:MAG TPA: cyclic nucleotide-binding domain-containing protein [bacterium]